MHWPRLGARLPHRVMIIVRWLLQRNRAPKSGKGRENALPKPNPNGCYNVSRRVTRFPSFRAVAESSTADRRMRSAELWLEGACCGFWRNGNTRRWE